MEGSRWRWARRRRRDAVVFARDGEVVGADLIGGVAVVRHAVRTDDDGVHLALGHEAGGGGVADERAGHLLEGNLVRGEARALVVGAGLVTVDVLEAAGLAEGADDAEGGAVARGGERPVLQWVRTRIGVPAGLPTAAQRASAPKAPMARLAATSAASMPSHSAMTFSAAASPVPSRCRSPAP